MYYQFNLLFTAINIAVILGGVLTLCAYLILAERKIAAYTQDRLGPNRVGPWGVFQPLADGVKFLLKEDIIPDHVDKVFYLLAPAIAVGTALFAICVVPWGATQVPPDRLWPETVAAEQAYGQEKVRTDDPASPTRGEDFKQRLDDYNNTFACIVAPHVDIGFLLVFAVGSLAVYGVILGGWSSNSKYSLLGSLRASAQIISYEIPLGMSVLGVVLLAGSMNVERIIAAQASWTGWFIVYQPLAFVLFLTAIFAECNRLPFDLSEAEQELVGGYHTEYSSMKFALFFLGEYAHLITTSFLAAALFLGGWSLPFLVTADSWVVWKVLVFCLKMTGFIVFSMFVRWTIPRFRFDQLMALAWKGFIPLALLNLLAVMVVHHLGASPWWLLPVSLVLLVGAAWVALSWPQAPENRPLVVHRGHEQVQITAR
jgi:NADH-quinone oxidoreductase subunit H